MKCPFCNHSDTQVIDTRLTDDHLTIKRRRKCLECDRRFNTFERPLLLKIKTDFVNKSWFNSDN